ncbi:hypothetical protein ACPW96_21595 [Micromonospora sp. DT81.3]|uniref:hypothetical protein n=1 Tax=Micromonospora sp. DT81.3 TaxID=3416523 RepID=UPI003CF81DA5
MTDSAVPEPPSFDEYCREHGISADEQPAAFAAYLHLLSGGQWDGGMKRVDEWTDESDAPLS